MASPVQDILDEFKQDVSPSQSSDVSDILSEYKTPELLTTGPQPTQTATDVSDILTEFQDTPSLTVAPPVTDVSDILSEFPETTQSAPIPAAVAPRPGMREVDRSGLTPVGDTGVVAGLGRSLVQGAAETAGGLLKAGQEVTTGRLTEGLLEGVGVPESHAKALGVLSTPFALPARIGEHVLGQPTTFIADKLRGFAQDIAPRITGTEGIVANAKQGNWGEAGKQLGFGVVRNIPQLAVLFATGGSAAGIGVLGAAAGGAKLQQLEADNPDINPAVARANAIGTGVVEALSEQLGSAGLVKRVLGGQVFKGGVKQAIAEVLRDAGIEAAEEAAAQIGENVIDMLTGQKEGSVKGIFEGIGDASVIGAVMGGGMGGVGTAMQGRVQAQPPTLPTKQPVDVNNGASVGRSGLVAEAKKYPTFDEFEKAWTKEQKHGQYWHITDNPNFAVDPERGPRDLSSLASGSESVGSLMITSDLEAWEDELTDDSGVPRKFAALIDMSEVPKDQYTQVSRGFGNEFFVDNPQNVKVLNTVPLGDAMRMEQEWQVQKPQSPQELRQVYDEANPSTQAPAELDTEAADVAEELSPPEPAMESPVEELTTVDPQTGETRLLTLAEQNAERGARERRANVEQGPAVELPKLNRFGKWFSKWIAMGEASIRGATGQKPAGEAFHRLRALAQGLHSFQQEAQGKVSTALDPITQRVGGFQTTGVETLEELNEVSFLMEEGATMTDAQVNERLQTPEQQELYNILAGLRDEITDLQKQKGVLSQETIDKIDAAFGGYMPHAPVAKAYLQILAEKMTDGERRATKGALLNRFHGKRKGNLTLRDYAEMTDPVTGELIFDPELFEPVRMTTDLLRDAYGKIAFEDTIRWGQANGWDVPNKEAAGTDYIPAIGNLKGVSTLGMKGRFMHPLWVDAINEIAGANKGPRGKLDKLLTITKIGQFFVPGIIFTYNELQGWQRGTRSYNPWLNAKMFARAVKEMIKNPATYAKMQALGAVTNPGRANLQSQQEQSEVFARRYRRDIAPRLKVGEAVFGVKQPFKSTIGKLFTKDWTKAILPTLQLPYRAVGKLTWLGDAIQRKQSFDTFMATTGKEMIKSGMSLEQAENEAGLYVGKAHGAYDIPSQAFRDLMHKIFFVHTFRVLMPMEVGKSVYGLPIDMYKKFHKLVTGKGPDVPLWKLKRDARAFVNTIGTPIAITMLMAANGWEPEDEGLPDWIKELQAKGTIGKIPIPLPFPTYKNYWKFRKTIEDENGQPRELVVGISDIVNMPMKWMSRATKDRPQRLDDTVYHLLDTFKWEINPLYRLGVDLVTNEPSMGGKRPADRTDPILKQIADSSWYAFSNIFRMYGQLTEVRGGDTAYRRQVKSDLNKGLNIIEKAMLGYYAGYTKPGAFVPTSFGYTYSRADRRLRFGTARQQLQRAIAQEKGIIKRESRGKPEEITRRLKELSQIRVERQRRLHHIFLGDR